MSDFFNKVKKAGVPVAISGKEENVFLTGFIRETDEEFLLIESISPSGNADGWACIRAEEVARADAATDCLGMLAKVYERFGEKNLPLKISSRDVLGSFIDQAIKNAWLCSVEVGFETLDKLTGYFVDRDFERVEMQLVGGNGQRDGFTAFDFEEIVLVTAAGEREKYLEKVIALLEEERNLGGKKRGTQEFPEASRGDDKRSKRGEQSAKSKGGEDNSSEEKDKKSRVLSFPKKDD